MVTVGENTQDVQRALGSARPMRVERGRSITTNCPHILRSLSRYSVLVVSSKCTFAPPAALHALQGLKIGRAPLLARARQGARRGRPRPPPPGTPPAAPPPPRWKRHIAERAAAAASQSAQHGGERVRARTQTRGAARPVRRGVRAWRAHLVLRLGRLRVRRQQRRHHRLRRLVGRGPVQRQPPTLRSAAAGE